VNLRRRPGREHDTTYARTHPDLLPALDVRIDSDHAALGDLGYEGENQRLTCPIKATAGTKLTATQQTVNASHSATAPWPNAETPCSRPRSRRCDRSACARGGSARSPQQHSSCSTTSTDTQPDQPRTSIATGKGSVAFSVMDLLG
jgi:hypothetical protein